MLNVVDKINKGFIFKSLQDEPEKIPIRNFFVYDDRFVEKIILEDSESETKEIDYLMSGHHVIDKITQRKNTDNKGKKSNNSKNFTIETNTEEEMNAEIQSQNEASIIDNLDFEIIRDMFDSMIKNNQYREIINKNFKSKFDEKKAKDIVEKLYEKTDPDDTEKMQNINHLSHQLSFIGQCMKEGTLPLPILKKLKYRSLVLDNYQINLKVATAFGKSLQHLGDSIDSIIMNNNNMKDEAAASVLEGLMKTSVSKSFHCMTIFIHR